MQEVLVPFGLSTCLLELYGIYIFPWPQTGIYTIDSQALKLGLNYTTNSLRSSWKMKRVFRIPWVKFIITSLFFTSKLCMWRYHKYSMWFIVKKYISCFYFSMKSWCVIWASFQLWPYWHHWCWEVQCQSHEHLTEQAPMSGDLGSRSCFVLWNLILSLGFTFFLCGMKIQNKTVSASEGCWKNQMSNYCSIFHTDVSFLIFLKEKLEGFLNKRIIGSSFYFSYQYGCCWMWRKWVWSPRIILHSLTL